MKASELRIGNRLLDKDNIVRRVAYLGDTIGLYNDIGGTDKYQHCPLYSNDIRQLKPIPLTEEWLLRFGFEDDEPHNKIALDEHGVMTLCFNQYSKMISLFSTGAHYYMPEIQYIHQIQNLYFALTGSDLEIKEGKDNVNDGQTGQMVEDRPGS